MFKAKRKLQELGYKILTSNEAIENRLCGLEKSIAALKEKEEKLETQTQEQNKASNDRYRDLVSQINDTVYTLRHQMKYGANGVVLKRDNWFGGVDFHYYYNDIDVSNKIQKTEIPIPKNAGNIKYCAFPQKQYDKIYVTYEVGNDSMSKVYLIDKRKNTVIEIKDTTETPTQWQDVETK